MYEYVMTDVRCAMTLTWYLLEVSPTWYYVVLPYMTSYMYTVYMDRRRE
jgi:hypothetical protein